MTELKTKPTMWGSGIVGFGAYRYPYASGHSGESCQVGFSSRKGDISVYLVAAGPDQGELLARLGKHKMGKACLSFRSLSDIDLKILEKPIPPSALNRWSSSCIASRRWPRRKTSA